MMKICKVNGCDKKYYAKGYCNGHYSTDLYKRSEKYRRGVKETQRKNYKKNREKILKYHKENYVHFRIAGKPGSVFTNGVTEEIKPLIPMIKNKVLNDCIKNPRKYLGDDDETA